MPVQKAFCLPFWRRRIKTRIFVPHFAIKIMYISASKGGVQKKFPLRIWETMQQTGGHGWIIAPPEAAATPEPPAKVEAAQEAPSNTAPVQKKKKANNEIPN